MIFSILALIATATAWSAPTLSGYRIVWKDSFSGNPGILPSSTNWNIITNISVNNEWQTYTTSNTNLQISGGDTLQIVPFLTNNKWTSGRIESKYVFLARDNKKTLAEAVIRFGSNAITTKKGIWPAFWMLSQTCRTTGTWPSCGEVDILETINGDLTGYATVHCDKYPGGACLEPTGIQESTSIPDQSWHRWRVAIDRTTGSWRTETIKWYRDDVLFQTLTGAKVGSETAWATLAHEPKYFIFNVAVGGDWPGATNSQTLGGWGAMMEVAYVAHYESR
ncbi:hypothetical protein BROUX41_002965 [Berkeleyomyces rouxiae]|uniref:uncharacterized protein n=1 Tax=Berkeleyomyces rouxiae TaxID=2035830 RepID=UPI003B7A92E5